jgi:hypothetical protein
MGQMGMTTAEEIAVVCAVFSVMVVAICTRLRK